MDAVFAWIEQNLLLTVLGAITLIQVTPIEINPWSWIGGMIKKGIGIADIQKELDDVKKDMRQDKVDNLRWNILSYGNSCRNGVNHSKEEWMHTISQLDEYKRLCAEENIHNGVIDEEESYLRNLYRERLERNDFL